MRRTWSHKSHILHPGSVVTCYLSGLGATPWALVSVGMPVQDSRGRQLLHAQEQAIEVELLPLD